MASAFTYRTAAKIYEALKPTGSSVEQLHTDTGLHRNTVLLYCREMEKRGFVSIEATRTEGGWMANLYFPIRKPVEPNTLESRVRDAIAALKDRKLSAPKARAMALKLLQGSAQENDQENDQDEAQEGRS